MSSSILLRPPRLASRSPSPSPSPSPISTPLPALHADFSSSSSSSTSESYLDPSSTRSPRRIRFAPLPEPDRDLLLISNDPSLDAPQSLSKDATQPVSPYDPHDDVLGLSPTVSPDSTICSIRSTPTIRSSADTPSRDTQKSGLKLLRRFSLLRRAPGETSSPVPQSAPLPSSRNTFFSSHTRSPSSAPTTPSFQSPRLFRISTDDILTLGRKSLFRNRSGSASSASLARASSPPPRRSDPSKHYLRSTSPGPATKSVDRKHDWGEGSSQSHAAAPAGSGAKKRRSSTSAAGPGAGGGRHSSVKMVPNDLSARPSTVPNSPLLPKKRHVKMLNGRVYGAKRYAAQTLANPFANVREEPEFVEWGYGGMGSVHASAGIGSDVWRGLQRSERGGALLAGSFGSPSASGNPATGAGGSKASGAHATSSTARRKMSDNIPECGMGNVGAGGGTEEDDGSGIAWLKKRRAEREAKARAEQEARELERKTQEKRKSGDSLDASMYASTASTTTSLTACTSAASTDLTTPTTSPLASRSPSVLDLNLTSSPFSESHGLDAAPSHTSTGEQPMESAAADPSSVPKDEHGYHVLTAVRLSPNLSSSSRAHERIPLRPIDTETIASTNSSEDGDELNPGSDEEEEQDDVEHEAHDVKRKTALGAGVEKVSRHVDAELR